MHTVEEINYRPQMPKKSRPIGIIGAGGIVRDAHLPAYQKAGWELWGICDAIVEKAEELKNIFNIGQVYRDVFQMVQSAPKNIVFDIAVPAKMLLNVLEKLPDGATVMMQKPMGEDIGQAKQIMEICKTKQFVAAVNFQMRFIPAVQLAKAMVGLGLIGDLHDIEIRMNIHHPWQLWKFLYGLPRMEMLYHSIHYMDLLRYFFGEPQKVYAKTLKHPKMMDLASTRSVILLEYDEAIRAFINTNHGHEFGLKYQDSFIKLEGTKGAIRTTLGMNLDYPSGVPDTFEYVLLSDAKKPEWQSVALDGTWFPDAFLGSMANLICYAEGSQSILENNINSAFLTMQLVECAYESSDKGGIVLH